MGAFVERSHEPGNFAHGLAVLAARGLNAPRSGLVHVDHETQKRTAKLNAAFYRHVIARNAPA